MITAIVRFKLPATIDSAKAAELFQGSAPKYQGLAGLIRKYYLFDAGTIAVTAPAPPTNPANQPG